MNWDSIIKAYPENRESILRAKGLSEKINEIMEGIEIPVIDAPLNEIPEPVLLDLISVCRKSWMSVFGKTPEWDMEKTVHAYLPDGCREMQDIKEDAKTFLSVLIKKYFYLLRKKNQGIIPEKWAKGNCPFCSTHPRVAFDSEQARTLFCPLCNHSWEFQRIKCVFCDNMDHTTLGYFEEEGLNDVRISFCNKCKHYIKVFDTKVKSASDPDTEDVLTLELNAIASREGFKD